MAPEEWAGVGAADSPDSNRSFSTEPGYAYCKFSTESSSRQNHPLDKDRNDAIIASCQHFTFCTRSCASEGRPHPGAAIPANACTRATWRNVRIQEVLASQEPKS